MLFRSSMKEIGLGAYALLNGTDTVVFEGSELPALSMGKAAGRISNEEYRTFAFANLKTAIIPEGKIPAGIGSCEGTVLEAGAFGFCGIISGESGNQIADNRQGVLGSAETNITETGITLQVDSSTIPEGANARAEIPGNDGSYILKITD